MLVGSFNGKERYFEVEKDLQLLYACREHETTIRSFLVIYHTHTVYTDGQTHKGKERVRENVCNHDITDT